MPTTNVTPINVRKLDALLSQELDAHRRIANTDTGPDFDVRLVVDVGDDAWWIATGDVSFDTVHGDLCAAATLCVSMTREELRDVRSQLINDIENQRADFDAEEQE